MGMVNVSVAEVRPTSGGVCVPFRYCQSGKWPLFAAFALCFATQSATRPGPPVTATVTVAPGATVIGADEPFTVTTGPTGVGVGVGVGAVPDTVTVGLV